jgi:hypothetical protein
MADGGPRGGYVTKGGKLSSCRKRRRWSHGHTGQRWRGGGWWFCVCVWSIDGLRLAEKQREKRLAEKMAGNTRQFDIQILRVFTTMGRKGVILETVCPQVAGTSPPPTLPVQSRQHEQTFEESSSHFRIV